MPVVWVVWAVYVARAGCVDTVKALIDAGANMELSSTTGATPLTVAAQEGQHLVVDLLLNHSADINHTTKDGASSVFIAAQYGHTKVIERLVLATDPPANLNMVTQKGGRSALYAAVEFQRKGVLASLVGARADLNIKTTDTGKLMDAMHGVYALKAFLGKEMNARFLAALLHSLTGPGFAWRGPCVHCACVTVGATWEPNKSACDLLSRVCRILSPSITAGRTPLYVATRNGYLEATRILCVGGADPNAKANDGSTAGGMAKACNYMEMLQVIQEHGGLICLPPAGSRPSHERKTTLLGFRSDTVAGMKGGSTGIGSMGGRNSGTIDQKALKKLKGFNGFEDRNASI